MRRPGFLRGKQGILIVAGAVLAAVLGGLWLEREPLLAWYYVRGLANAEEGERDIWVERIAGLGSAAVPRLLDCLRRDDSQVCANARAALVRLVQSWGPDDPRCAELADQLVEAFPACSLLGQVNILEAEAALVLRGGARQPPALIRATGRILSAAGHGTDKGLLARALALADLLVEQPLPANVLRAVHDLARTGLTAPDAHNRTRAIHLTRCKLLNDQTDLLELVLPLLRDSSAEVRREALRGIGLKKELISDDDLLTWLHDPDREVRRWCAKALRARGRSEMDIQLGRLITDDRAQERLKIFSHLRQARDQEPGVWIRRLCDDPEPAVRIAAARAAAEQELLDLADRLRDMAQNDRSPTVRQVVEHYYRATTGRASR